jgi:predicted PhzF superfamily epimerase YddE/YHI9
VTSRSDADEFDFVSRFFAPDHGIDEDPVTGSAHCFLGPYWAERLGKQQVVGFQASRRGGVVGVRVGGEGIEQGRVELRGQAVTVLRGWLENCDRM